MLLGRNLRSPRRVSARVERLGGSRTDGSTTGNSTNWRMKVSLMQTLVERISAITTIANQTVLVR